MKGLTNILNGFHIKSLKIGNWAKGVVWVWVSLYNLEFLMQVQQPQEGQDHGSFLEVDGSKSNLDGSEPGVGRSKLWLSFESPFIFLLYANLTK